MASPEPTLTPELPAAPETGAATRPPLTRRSPLKLALLVLVTTTLLVVHYTTPAIAEHESLHDLHRQLLYVPLILAAFWYGWRGGLLAAVVVSGFYFSHMLHHLHHLPLTDNLNRALELLTYLLIGGGTGYLVDRLRGEERNLLTANQRLERAMQNLTEKTREVFESEEQLRRADRLAALGQLTTGLAHEIRNPLASIRGAAEILGDPGVPPPQREEFGRIMIEETQRLDRVVTDFLDYARARKAEAAEAGDLARVLEKTAALSSRPLKDAAVTLEIALPERLPLLAISENLLQQVLLNLFLNAIQAMGAAGGGGRLRVEARLSPHEKTATILISDTGPGIPREAAERIFDPFFTTKPQGLGLGLSIVHKIVANYQGRIAVDPDYTAGARFLLTLPLA